MRCRKHSPAVRVFSISLVFSNARRVISLCDTRVRLFYLLNKTWVILSHRVRTGSCSGSFVFQCKCRHRGEGGAGGALAPPLFWLIKLLFQFFSKVLHKKVHRVILCQTCGPQRKHCFFLIAPFFSTCSTLARSL